MAKNTKKKTIDNSLQKFDSLITPEARIILSKLKTMPSIYYGATYTDNVTGRNFDKLPKHAEEMGYRTIVKAGWIRNEDYEKYGYQAIIEYGAQAGPPDYDLYVWLAVNGDINDLDPEPQIYAAKRVKDHVLQSRTTEETYEQFEVFANKPPVPIQNDDESSSSGSSRRYRSSGYRSSYSSRDDDGCFL